MDTQQRPDVREPARRTGWRTAAIAFVAIILAVGAIAGIAAMVGDDGDDVVAPPETTTAVVPPVTTELRLTFLEGGACTYEGPTELQTGPVELIFINESDVWSKMNFVILDEGYTIQDVIDEFGPQPSTRPGPSWTKAMGNFEAVAAGETLSWRFDLEPGVYAMVCGRQRPRQGWEGWFGAGLTVEG